MSNRLTSSRCASAWEWCAVTLSLATMLIALPVEAACGDGGLDGIEECDDGNTNTLDGCSDLCEVEGGWACSCAAPVFTYGAESLAGRIGGDGGNIGPEMRCAGKDILIGLNIDWSDGSSGTATRTTTICGQVDISAQGVVSTTKTTTETSGGDGRYSWDPSTASGDVLCPSGYAIVGLQGVRRSFTLFSALSIVCQKIAVDGSPGGIKQVLEIAGGSGTGEAEQIVDCPAGQIAVFFQTRADAGQDALDLYCAIPSTTCSGVQSVCGTLCGDGEVGAPVEACDDGAESKSCNDDCTVAACGDSKVNTAAGETCDDGTETSSCDADCTAPECGDGLVNSSAGESCDDAGESDSCNSDCSKSACGDGILNASAGEACDDGNTAADDGCSASCQLEVCGNAVVEGFEACDEGGESELCNADCSEARCGDGIVNMAAGEQCDDDSELCNADCTLAGCGDGIVNSSEEECDDAGESADCNANCTVAECGDGSLNQSAGEECDDGNLIDGDGCNADCMDEDTDVELKGGGFACSSGAGTAPFQTGSLGGLFGVLLAAFFITWRHRQRRNG